MFRLLGVLLTLVLGLAALGYYLDWFSVSTSGDGTKNQIDVTVLKDKIKADQEAAKKKLEEAEKRFNGKAKSVTDK